MILTDKIKDKLNRHKERHSSSGCHFVFSDSIRYVNKDDWDRIADGQSVFLSREYLQAIERCSPENTVQRYAIAYEQGVPLVIVACQVADINGERLVPASSRYWKSLFGKYGERVLVCGNLVSSGLHGVAFANGQNPQSGWRLLAEMLYRIRRGEKLSGNVDFVLIKDIKGEVLEESLVMERYSYRRIQTDPDMVIELAADISTFDNYLDSMTSKYRSRIRKTIKALEDNHFACEKIDIDDGMDKQLYDLYLQVEEKSATRLARLPQGYFHQLQQALPELFSCYIIKRDDVISGFVTIVKDDKQAIAYYVGLDYSVNQQFPVYFRLLQLVIEAAIEMRCTRIAFGRTALEPKANLGAKPVDAYVWVRHRVPVVNYMVRKLFRNVPFEDAPKRSALK